MPLCAVRYDLYNLKNVKNTRGGVLLLVKVQASHGCFSRYLYYTNCTKSRKVSHKIHKELFKNNVRSHDTNV